MWMNPDIPDHTAIISGFLRFFKWREKYGYDQKAGQLLPDTLL